MADAELERLSQLPADELKTITDALAAKILTYPPLEKIPVDSLGEFAQLLLFGYTEYVFPFEYDINDDDDKDNYTVQWWKDESA